MRGARRSVLFVPASEDRFIAKAAALSGLDAVILDLEDGVSPGRKDEARAKLPDAVHMLHTAGREVFVRINDLKTCRGLEDLLFAAELGTEGLLLPKILPAALTAADQMLAAVEDKLGAERDSLRVLLMIETAGSIQRITELFAASRRIDALVFGAEDYTNDLGVVMDKAGPTVLFAQTVIVNAARAHGVDAIDSPCTDHRHPDACKEEVLRAKALGFTGKTAIHPSAVEIIRQAFTPDASEVERAKRLLSAYEKGLAENRGAVSFEGRMIDRPVAERAKKLLERARASV